MDVVKETTTVVRLVETTVQEPTGRVTFSLSPEEARRVGRVLAAYAAGVEPYIGVRTKAAVTELVNQAGWTLDNTRPI